MLSDRMFVQQSLDLNLFFLRILKEHAFFMQVSFPCKNDILIQQANTLKNTIDNLLYRAIYLSQGVVNLENDMVTPYTLNAEMATESLTGENLNTQLTQMTMSLRANPTPYPYNPVLIQNVYLLNTQALAAAKAIVDFKTKVLNDVLQCNLYTTNYPLLIDHIRREALLYMDLLQKLLNRDDVDIIKDAVFQETFWNRIMAEHAKFIRGYLDPTEEALFDLANNFGNEFDELTAQALELTENINNLPKVTDESLEATEEFKGFKVQGTEGILNCEIRSIIVPLLADHVLREANHYLILLSKYDEIQQV